ADLKPEYDDEREQALFRIYTLTFQAHPWPRSATKIITPAVATASATVVNNGSSTTGWTAPNTASPVVSVVSGAVQVAYDGDAIGGGYDGARLRLTSTVDTDPDHYVGVDWKSSVPAYQFFLVDGASLTEVRREPGATAGYTRSWYSVAANSGTTLELQTVHQPATGTPTLSIDQILKSATLPNTGTGRQLSRTINPGGSVPTEGDVIVQHPTSGLGQTIVFTHPSGGGYSPPLRQWRFSSDTVTPDASVVSGNTNQLTGGNEYRVPVSAIPDGDVQLWARLYSSAAGTVQIFWAADSWMGGVQVGDTQGGVFPTAVTWATAATWQIVFLGRFALPAAKVGPAGFHRIALQRDTNATASVYVDDAWLFAMDKGRLTVVDAGSGTPTVGTVANRLRITAPSLEEPHGGIALANASDWSDSYTPPTPRVLCDQVGHRFDPDGSNVLVVTPGALDASVSLEHFRKWHTNAGD
ncbi:MAG: hypothetical protein H0X12_15825, partial [Nocardioides sp.]|nr:hypothetical protein [Nocardioides sp.]